jgi:hypothetical protein
VSIDAENLDTTIWIAKRSGCLCTSHNATLELLEATIYRLAFPKEPWSLARTFDALAQDRLSLQLAFHTFM